MTTHHENIFLKKETATHFSSFFYDCSIFALWLFFRIFCRVHLIVLEAPPAEGPCIVASNHISHFDPALLSSFFPRALDWVAMKELFSKRWSALFFSRTNVISVDRFGKDLSSNRRALRTILKRLSLQRSIGIFPEGGIRTHQESILEGAPMKNGLVSLSLLSQAPIVPCVILGTDRLYVLKNWRSRPHLWMIIGKAITPLTPEKSKKTALHLEQELSTAFPALLQELRNRFQLEEDDLPQTAQERRIV